MWRTRNRVACAQGRRAPKAFLWLCRVPRVVCTWRPGGLGGGRVHNVLGGARLPLKRLTHLPTPDVRCRRMAAGAGHRRARAPGRPGWRGDAWRCLWRAGGRAGWWCAGCPGGGGTRRRACVAGALNELQHGLHGSVGTAVLLPRRGGGALCAELRRRHALHLLAGGRRRTT